MSSRNTPTRHGTVVRALKSLDAKQAVGAGTAFTLDRAYSAFGVELYRGTTSATNESTSASVTLQGQIGSTGTWITLGAAITVNSATPTITRSTNSIPVFRVRMNIASYTTSAGAASTGENKIPITGYIAPGFGSS